MSVLEASAAGIPVVATNATGTAETMQPGTTGLVVPVGDITAIASAMSQVMSMPPADRQQLGAHGRQFVAEHFSLPAITTRWEQLYANLLALHSHPSRSG